MISLYDRHRRNTTLFVCISYIYSNTYLLYRSIRPASRFRIKNRFSSFACIPSSLSRSRLKRCAYFEEENDAFVIRGRIALCDTETIDNFIVKLIDDRVDLCRAEANTIGIQRAIAERANRLVSDGMKGGGLPSTEHGDATRHRIDETEVRMIPNAWQTDAGDGTSSGCKANSPGNFSK